MAEAVAKKKGFKIPHIFAFLFMIVMVVSVLTYIIPAGEYERNKITLENGKTQVRVVPNSYKEIPQNPQGPLTVIPALVKGFTQGGSMIFMIFFCGAAVFILEKTGTVNVLFQRIVRKVKGREHYAIFIIMFLMSMGGATGALANTTLALIPLGMVLSRALGYDNVVAFCMVYLGAYAGFNVGWGNVFTVGIAHNIAELPEFSGFEVRVLFHIVNFILTYGFVMLYVKRIKADPTSSLNYEEGMQPIDYIGSTGNTEGEVENMTIKHILCSIVTVLGFGGIIYGSMAWGWGVPQFSAIFLAMSIFCGLFGGLGVDGTAENFVKGCATMVTGAFILGIARAVSVVMSEGKILDSVVFYLSESIVGFGPVVGANLVFLLNVVVNFFVTSGSGQAVAVMPLMVPLADLLGITRQVAVQAFQFGDGFSNCIFPTAGTLMSALAMTKIPYGKYVKWYLPFIAIQTIFAFIALTVLQSIGWQ